MKTSEQSVLPTQEQLEYLDDLRESGKTNMFGARPYLMRRFSLTSDDAGRVLSYWMHTFPERHSHDKDSK